MVYLPTFTIKYHKNQPNVGKYTIHGCYGIVLYPLRVASCPFRRNMFYLKQVELDEAQYILGLQAWLQGILMWFLDVVVLVVVVVVVVVVFFCFRTSWQLGPLKKQKGNSSPMFADRKKSSVGSKFQGAMSNLRLFDKVSISISKKSTNLFIRKPDACPHCYARFPEV